MGPVADDPPRHALHLRARPTSTATPPSASRTTSTAPPSSWRRASTAPTSSSARSSSPSAWSRAYQRPLHAAAASRLRVRRLVLALRRRGLAVPVLLHLCLGRRRASGGRRPLTERSTGAYDEGRREPPFAFAERPECPAFGASPLCVEASAMSQHEPAMALAPFARACAAVPALRRGKAVPGLPDAAPSCKRLRARLFLRRFRRRPGVVRHADRRLPHARRALGRVHLRPAALGSRRARGCR